MSIKLRSKTAFGGTDAALVSFSIYAAKKIWVMPATVLEFYAAIVSAEKIYRDMAILTHHVRSATGHRDDLPVVKGHKTF